MDNRRTIKELLRSLAADKLYLGQDYVTGGILLIAEDAAYLHGVSKRLYPELAKQFKTSAGNVERDIRTFIAAAWGQTDHSRMNEIAGRKLNRRPTNKVFFDMLISYMAESGL